MFKKVSGCLLEEGSEHLLLSSVRHTTNQGVDYGRECEREEEEGSYKSYERAFPKTSVDDKKHESRKDEDIHAWLFG